MTDEYKKQHISGPAVDALDRGDHTEALEFLEANIEKSCIADLPHLTPAPQQYDDLVMLLVSPATVFYEYAADEGALLKEAAAAITALQNRIALDAGLAEGYKRVIADLQQQVREARGKALQEAEKISYDNAERWNGYGIAELIRALKDKP